MIEEQLRRETARCTGRTRSPEAMQIEEQLRRENQRMLKWAGCGGRAKPEPAREASRPVEPPSARPEPEVEPVTHTFMGVGGFRRSILKRNVDPYKEIMRLFELGRRGSG
jgi:hypothetical protein